MTLQSKLDALKVEFESKAPPEAIAILHRVTDDLIASGQAGRALQAGDRAPTFTLQDSNGNSVSSVDLLAKGPLVLSFYRGVWCPYCNLELQALEEARVQLEQLGASLVGISQQTAANTRKSQRDNSVNFPIVSDTGGDVAEAFGIRWTLPDDLRHLHVQFGADLTAFNGDDSWALPMPARYVIGQDGVIAYSEINPDYTQRPEPNDMFATLEKLKSAQTA